VLPVDNLARRAGSESSLASLEYLAYERIKEAIITLALPPGSPIVEVQLAERLGISKTPLRAALMQLERQGLVVSVPYRGSRVAPITLKQIAQLYQLREAIEVYAVREGIRSCTEADFDALEELLRRQEQAAGAGDTDAAHLLDGQFHRYLIERLENPYLTEIFRTIADHRRRLRHALAGSVSGPSLTAAPQHWRRLEALRAGDVAAAERNVVEAIQTGLRMVDEAERAGRFECSPVAAGG
jgi:DNA-binding GntR family transcriptional regulator